MGERRIGRDGRAGGVDMAEEDVLKVIDGAVKGVLGMSEGEKIDENSPLRDLGFDSMLSVELRDRLSAQLGTQLSATILFDYPTLKALRRKILELVGDGEGAGAADGKGGAARGGRRRRGRSEAGGRFGMGLLGPGEGARGQVGIYGSACRFGDAWTMDGLILTRLVVFLYFLAKIQHMSVLHMIKHNSYP